MHRTFVEYTCEAGCKLPELRKEYNRLKQQYINGVEEVAPRLKELHTLRIDLYSLHELPPDEQQLRWSIYQVPTEQLELSCPICGQRALRCLPRRLLAYTRGYGWKDRKGAKRDMNLHKLTNDDPYSQYRADGEADDLADRLRKAGKHGFNDRGERTRTFGKLPKHS